MYERMNRLINVVRPKGGNSRGGTGTPSTWETDAEAPRRNHLASNLQVITSNGGVRIAATVKTGVDALVRDQ